LYVNEKKRLVPLAIRLYMEPDDLAKNPIFTPLDPKPDWLYARLFFAQADLVRHQLNFHLTVTHLAPEPIVLATHRQLSTCHPVSKLILPHSKFQIAINARARQNLIAKDGPIDEISSFTYEGMTECIKMGFKKWRFDQSSLPNILKNNNITDNPEDLPNYYYRDDGLKLWNEIHTFVGKVMRVYYHSDADVAGDFELQNWANEIYETGFNGEDKGFPKQITTINQLIEVIATFIWIVSPQHAVLNFAQYDSFAFIPAAPPALYITPPIMRGKWVKGKITMDDLYKGLPSKAHTVKQIALVYILSQYSTDDATLGNYPEHTFIEPEVLNAMAEFKRDLKAVGDEIDKRKHWSHLHPKKIPNSTAI